MVNFSRKSPLYPQKKAGQIFIVSDIPLISWLVVSTPLKNMKVNGKDDIPYIMENKKKCLKPPTSIP